MLLTPPHPPRWCWWCDSCDPWQILLAPPSPRGSASLEGGANGIASSALVGFWQTPSVAARRGGGAAWGGGAPTGGSGVEE